MLLSGELSGTRMYMMPHKHNDDRRHKISKRKFEVTNWAAYNESLRRRGDLTIWVSSEALSRWSAPRRTSPGGQPKHSDLAVTMCSTLHVIFNQPLRQTQGMMRSIAKLMSVEIPVPDFSTLSRRGKGLALPPRLPQPTASLGPFHLVIDSTGLTVFGEGEWLENKHKIRVKCKKMAQAPPWSRSCQRRDCVFRSDDGRCWRPYSLA